MTTILSSPLVTQDSIGNFYLDNDIRSISFILTENAFFWKNLIRFEFGLVGATKTTEVSSPNNETLIITHRFSNGAVLTITLSQKARTDLLIHGEFTGPAGTYSLTLTVSGLSGVVIPTNNKITVQTALGPFTFDWSTLPLGKLSLSTAVGRLTLTLTTTLAPGETFVFEDPVDGSGGGSADDPVNMRWSGKRLFGQDSDKNDKIWLCLGNIEGGGNCLFSYSNNGGTSFTNQNLGASFQTLGGAVTVAYDKPNDKFILVFARGIAAANPNVIKIAQGTINRDGAGNITGVTMGTVLTITETVGNWINDCDAWFLDNGEVGVVWAYNDSTAPFNSQTRFIRVVFGSPPTYKNLAGTASTIDNVGTSFTATTGFSLVNLAQSPFDSKLWGVWVHIPQTDLAASTVYKYSSGSLGGAWAAETLLFSAGAVFDSTQSASIKINAQPDNTIKPQIVISLAKDNFSSATSERLFGITDGGSPVQIDSDQENLYFGQFHPIPLALANLTIEGTREAAYVWAERTAAPFNYDILFQTWDGVAFGAKQLIFEETNPDIAGAGLQCKHGRSDKIEVIYGRKDGITLNWSVEYHSFDFAAPPVSAVRKFYQRINAQVREVLSAGRLDAASSNIRLTRGFRASRTAGLGLSSGRRVAGITALRSAGFQKSVLVVGTRRVGGLPTHTASTVRLSSGLKRDGSLRTKVNAADKFRGEIAFFSTRLQKDSAFAKQWQKSATPLSVKAEALKKSGVELRGKVANVQTSSQKASRRADSLVSQQGSNMDLLTVNKLRQIYKAVKSKRGND